MQLHDPLMHAVKEAAHTDAVPAQFEVFNAQSNRLVRVGTYTTGTLTIVNSSAIVYSTGERVAPSFPFRNCTKLASCADCLAQANFTCAF